MKRSKKFFKLEEKSNGDVFWKDVFIQPLGENRISVNNHQFDITPHIQAYLTNTKLTTKFLDNVEKETVFEILKNVGFLENIPKIGFNSARMKDALYILQKEIAKFRNPTLPSIEKVVDSSELEGEGLKIIIPFNIVDIYTRFEVLLGLKLSGHTDTLTEASALIDQLYKMSEIQNKQQNRIAPNTFSTQ